MMVGKALQLDGFLDGINPNGTLRLAGLATMV